MPGYTYLIVGGGMTADAAVKGIRSIDPEGTISIISNEAAPPYKRPPLSKALWKGEPVESVDLKTGERGVQIHLSRNATRIDGVGNVVIDDQGLRYTYEKLLLATGGAVRTLPFDAEGIIYFRTIDDYRNLHSLTDRHERFAIIGGGFIGSEVGAALAMNGKNVTMIFPEEGIGARVYSKRISNFLNEYYRSKGVTILAQDGVTNAQRNGKTYIITTKSGSQLQVDGVVAGLGILPNTSLAASAGLTIDNGIVVNEFLQTTIPNIYAAGDVANFFNVALGKHVRVEHEDNAVTMGEQAGKNMAGGFEAYRHLPFFYSDLFDIGYEAVGELDARLDIVEDWKEEFREGVLYYIGEGRVRGVLLWNTWGQVENARKLIAAKGPFTREDLKGWLPS